jgi:hypothetical protein
MEESLESNSSKSKKERTSWEKETRINGITEGISVRKVSNGYVICVYKRGYPDNNYDDKYIDEGKEYVSTTNPLESDPDAKDIDLSGDALKEIRNIYFD